MDMIITDIDAIRAHRIARTKRPPFRLVPAYEPIEPGPFGQHARFIREVIEPLQMLGLAREGQPLHLRVSKESQRPRFAEVICHVRPRKLPLGSFWKLVPSDARLARALDNHSIRIFADSPELCVVNRAATMPRSSGKIADKIYPIARAFALASEFCGLYSLDPDDPANTRPTYEVSPVLTPEQLVAFVDMPLKLKGQRAARVADRYVAAGQGSPMEAALLALMTFRPGLGGLNLPLPVANKPLDLSQRQLALIKHEQLTPDFFWMLYLLVLEYEGSDHFTSSGAREDKRRVFDYQMLGYTMLPVTDEDVRGVEQLDLLLARVTEHMAKIEGNGFKHRVKKNLRNPDYRNRRSYLLSLLKSCD